MRLAWFVFLLLASAAALPGLDLARPFGSHMVLPMGRPVPVWGSAEAGADVVVRFGGWEKTASAGEDGAWRVELPELAASAEGRELIVEAGGESLVLENVLVGEVWLCSGQSNMDFALGRATGGREEAGRAGELPAIRLFNLIGVSAAGMVYGTKQLGRLNVEEMFEGCWQMASESETLAFSAVGWWAGKTIHQARRVPVGLIDNSVGGSGAEAWLPREMLEQRADYAELLGPQWLESEKVGDWARGRAKLNLGGRDEVNHPFRPGFLFDSGVRWWRGFPLSGVLWYQGETNAELHDDAWNGQLITDLVTGWRRVLGQEDLPFFMVQLPRIGGSDPIRKWWPEFRRVQARTAGKLDGVECVVTEDLGWDSPDVHPPDKRPVGERLGRAAAGVADSGSVVESFEELPAGGFMSLTSGAVRWSAAAGHAEVHAGHAKTGNQSMRLPGGGSRELTMEWKRPLAKGGELRFWSERWTARDPFLFRIDVRAGPGPWKEVYNGDRVIRIGGFLTEVAVPLDPGTTAVRFRSNAPANSGVMMDDMTVQPAEPMKIAGVEVSQPVIPALIRKQNNPVIGINVQAAGSLSPRKLTALKVTLVGTTRPEDVTAVRVIPGGPDGPGGDAAFGGDAGPRDEIIFRGEHVLDAGDNWFWVCVELSENTDISGRVDAVVKAVKFDDGTITEIGSGSPDGSQRIGWALRMRGDDGSQAFRIPGLATTNKGTLIGVYDVRRGGGGDLPGNIDVGMSRSTDGGQSWEPMQVIMDMGDDPKWSYDGIGDPAVLVDKGNNRVWVAATWSHGNRSWRGSGKGMKPEETGQLMLVSSDDDGRTWSKPVNITEQVKDPDWHFVLQGPGRGITMKDGTIVFPAQFQAGDSRRTPHSTLIYSKDHGKTWAVGTGVKSDTTEAQLVELGDGSIMINCRDDRGGARTIATTADLGRSWTLHPTDRKALNEPTCMASLLRIEHPRHGPLLIFSNPNTPLPGVPRGRYNMTVKVSADEGMTWPEKWHSMYDIRKCSGYSCLSPIGENHVGVLYEGPAEIYFLRFGIDELMGSQ